MDASSKRGIAEGVSISCTPYLCRVGSATGNLGFNKLHDELHVDEIALMISEASFYGTIGLESYCL